MSSGHDFQKGRRTDGVFLCLPFAFLLCCFIDDGQQLNEIGAPGCRQELQQNQSSQMRRDANKRSLSDILNDIN